MDRAELGSALFNILNDYSDFTKCGFALEHDVPDLAHLNSLELKAEPLPAEAVEVKKSEPVNSAPKERVVIKRVADTAEVKLKRRSMVELAQEVFECRACPLHQGTPARVPGIGEVSGRLLVLTYPPSAEEEAAGRPLVGRLGQFFNKWLSAIGLSEEEIFISSIIKCAPKGRPLDKIHFEKCRPFLERQIELVAPSAILTLGQLTLSSLLKEFKDLNLTHGQKLDYKGTPFIATYHPFDVLKNPSLKKAVWEDLQRVQPLLKDS